MRVAIIFHLDVLRSYFAITLNHGFRCLVGLLVISDDIQRYAPRVWLRRND